MFTSDQVLHMESQMTQRWPLVAYRPFIGYLSPRGLPWAKAQWSML